QTAWHRHARLRDDDRRAPCGRGRLRGRPLRRGARQVERRPLRPFRAATRGVSALRDERGRAGRRAPERTRAHGALPRDEEESPGGPRVRGAALAMVARSEERRVGKEWRWGWGGG